MKKFVLLCTVCALISSANLVAQPNIFNHNDPIVETDTVNPPPTPPANTLAKWVRTKRLTWNTDRFKSYYYNGMAFRLRYPNNYDPSDVTKKYPVVLFLHGGGDIRPVYDNELQLVNIAQSMEQMMNEGQFNAFMLFPQVSEQDIWQDYHFSKINNFLDSMQKYVHSDQDRLMTMGLSMGAFGAFRYSAFYPQRSTLAAAAAPALIEAMPDADKNKLLHIPLWVGYGGLDPNPSPASVQNFINYITSNGGSIKQNFYPELGHFVWGSMFIPPFILPFWTTSHKANPAVFFGKNQYDRDVPIDTKMGLTPGFFAYEWQRDNATIASSTNGSNSVIDPLIVTNYTGNEIRVNSYGTYRARFKRTSTSDWSEWSQNPAIIYNGLKFKYYEGNWTSLPDFNSLTPIASGTSPNVDINSRPPATYNNFAMKWEGQIYIPAAGDYTFETLSDDGSKLYFNTAYSAGAVATVNNDGTHGADFPATGTVAVGAPGWYPIVITYFENTAGESMKVFWTGPGISRQEIPNSAFTRASVLTDNSAPTAPANLKSDYTGRTFADLSWNASTDNVGVVRYDVYMNGVFNASTTSTKFTVNSLTTGTVYNFTIKALDQAGNASAFSNQITATAAANGLRYKYYEGNWTVLPNFNTLPVLKTGTTANVDLTPKIANNQFGFVWEGYIRIPSAGNYTFETASDDGSKLYFNTFYSPSANALVNNDGQHGVVTATGSTGNIAAGWYPITITFFDATLDESIQVYWSGPGITRQLVPDAAFVENTGADVTAPTAPTNLKSDYTGRTFVDLSWTAATDNVGVVRYDVYVNGAFSTSSTSLRATVANLTAGTAYTIALRAFDQAGNASAPSNQITPTASANGLRYRYYEGSWTVLPDFSSLPVLKIGTSANVDLSPRIANNQFGFVWEGYIRIPSAGNYTFETASDDGSKLYFNTFYSPSANALVNNDGQHGVVSVTGSTGNIAAGWYPITITFFDATLDESIQVYWSGPGFTRQLVPDAAFVENTGADNTAPSAPANLKSDYTGRTFADLSWGASTDNVGVVRYDVYVNSTYRLSTTELKTTIDNLATGTAYTFNVKAFDQANNESAFSNQITATAAANGLRYKYYEGNWTVLPNFSTLPVLKTGTTANVDLTPKIANNQFGFVWEGYIRIPTAGNYTFETASDDGSKLYFNTFYSPSANALVNNDGQHGVVTATGSTGNIAAGWYPITITFFDATLDESIQVYWSGPGITRQLVPDAAFIENTGADITAPTAPTNLKSDYTGRTFVNLSWTAATDNVGVVRYDVYVNGAFSTSSTNLRATVANLTAGTAYTIALRAFDQAGNASAPSNQITPTASANGLRYRYYEGSWSILPDFNNIGNAVKMGTSANVDLTPKISNDNFGFVWEGYIRIPTAGNYTFETISDDGSKLYFNTFFSQGATALVNNDGQHGPITASGSTGNIAAGWYPIAVTFFERSIGESIQVYWSGPGISRQLIPDAAFVEGSGGGSMFSEEAFRSGLIGMADSDQEKIERVSVYPNPFVKDLQIGFYNTAKDNNISVDIYDLSGRRMYIRNFGKMAAGINTLRLNLSGQSPLNAGTYIARLQVNGIPVKTWKIVKLKK